MNSASTKRRRATFTVPADTLERFSLFVPERQRSQVVTELMAAETARREALLMEACDAANEDSGVREVEEDFQQFGTPTAEEWRD